MCQRSAGSIVVSVATVRYWMAIRPAITDRDRIVKVEIFFNIALHLARKVY
jgi:hypothetical protein